VGKGRNEEYFLDVEKIKGEQVRGGKQRKFKKEEEGEIKCGRDM